MALYSQREDDDEFFGNDDEAYQAEFRPGLETHEDRAKEEEYRNIGYLEAFETNKEARLQEGFEAGYRETFDAALRIGELLGQSTFPSKLSNNVQTEATATSTARYVRDFLERYETTATSTSNATTELEQLERGVKYIVQK
jgi:hypothetical protein